MSDKDWTGNKKSTFVTLGASSHSEGQREVDDYYATDPICATDLLNLNLGIRDVWECACGEGHLAKVFKSAGVLFEATDLVNRGYGDTGVDFLKESSPHDGWIVTNPPYKYALEFCEHALSLCDNVAMFLKLTFLEGQKRRLFFYNTRLNTFMFTRNAENARLAVILTTLEAQRQRTLGLYGTKIL